MNRTRGLMLVSLLAIAVVLANSSSILTAMAQNKGSAPDLQLPPGDPPWMSQLTDDQKAQIQQLIESMKDSGATPQEIRDAVNAKLQEWGIEVPEVPVREPPWMSQLNDDQKTEIQQLTQSMKDSGASQEKIRDAINAKLQDWGIQLPEDNGGHHQPPPWMSQLTDDQKTQIEQMVQSMKGSGATPQEIGDAVNAKLQEWGIQLPELSDGQPTNSTRPPRDPPWMSQLTDDQKAQIQQLIESMKDSGATPQEIRDAVNAKLQEWGIQVPLPPQSPGQ